MKLQARENYEYLADDVVEMPGISRRSVAIFRGWLSGKSQEELGNEFGITKARIGQILGATIRRAESDGLVSKDVDRFSRIADLPVSTRFKTAICAAFGPDVTLSDLSGASEADFLRLPNFGPRSVALLERLKRRVGL